MNTIAKPIFATALILSLGIGAASSASAKGHNQGFGAGTAGPATAGQVDDGQKNLTGGREGSYGIRDQVPEVRENQAAGIHGNSVEAQDKEMNHPSMKDGSAQ